MLNYILLCSWVPVWVNLQMGDTTCSNHRTAFRGDLYFLRFVKFVTTEINTFWIITERIYDKISAPAGPLVRLRLLKFVFTSGINTPCWYFNLSPTNPSIFVIFYMVFFSIFQVCLLCIYID